MPTARRLRGTKGKDVEVKDKVKPIVPSNQGQRQRPRTRAWVKQEEERKKGATTSFRSASPPAKKDGTSRSAKKTQKSQRRTPSRHAQSEDNTLPQPADRKNRKARSARGQLAAATVDAHTKRVGQGEELDGRTRSSRNGESGESILQKPGLSAWLDDVQTVQPANLDESSLVDNLPVDDCANDCEGSMAPPPSDLLGSFRTPSTVDNTTLTKQSSQRPKSVTWKKLQNRCVRQRPTKDEKFDAFRDLLRVDPPQMTFQKTGKLLKILDAFANRTSDKSDEDAYPALDRLTNDINQWSSQVKIPTITESKFQDDLERGRESNEAVFQRTFMMSIIDRFEISSKIDFNCEGQWSIPKEYRLVSLQKDGITLPKPDLAMFFKLESFTGDRFLSLPEDLDPCLSPNPCPTRCFPFLFMEVKRGAEGLEAAIRANLNAASQSLFNIYHWVVRADSAASFFEDIRVFSIVLNAQELRVRVHRACRNERNTLDYHYSDFAPVFHYNKDQACLLVRNILDKYASEKLHPILKGVFETVSKREEELLLSTEKALENDRPSTGGILRNEQSQHNSSMTLTLGYFGVDLATHNMSISQGALQESTLPYVIAGL
ncbi:MAG: hypothetical protein M1837_007369 [Sclerophora amabilis]|nr:MAG: hypothetical protein M1837_007369 [Sclerophora amabilis]